jgi:hypothetical protein
MAQVSSFLKIPLPAPVFVEQDSKTSLMIEPMEAPYNHSQILYFVNRIAGKMPFLRYTEGLL